MNNYTWEYIQSNQKDTKESLGINYEQLKELIEYLKFLEEEQKKEREKQKVRINKAGGGRTPKMKREEQIVLTLIYLRHNLNFKLSALMFKVSKSTANNTFNYWQNI